jgi:hypothetical protein
MRFFEQLPHRDYEEALRSLGRLLDDHRLEDILVVELADGFMATGLRPTDGAGRDPIEVGTPRSYEHAEAMFVDPDVDAASKHGQTLRGTGREAGRYEEALRLIGRRVNADEGALVLVVDQGDAYLVRMISRVSRDLPYRYASFRTAEFDRIRDEALAARSGTVTPAFPSRKPAKRRRQARASRPSTRLDA